MLIMDMPGERSLHSVSTPRGGGIAIVMTYAGSLSILLVSGMVPASLGIALIGSGMGVGLIGFVDDIRHVNAGIRLLVHFLASWWALYWLGGLPSLELFHYHPDLGLMGLLLAVFSLYG
jgi:Fuc2NAc and GlcNAc transferase